MAKKTSERAMGGKLAALRAQIARHGKAILRLDQQVRRLERYAHKHSKMKYVLPIAPSRSRATKTPSR